MSRSRKDAKNSLPENFELPSPPPPPIPARPPKIADKPFNESYAEELVEYKASFIGMINVVLNNQELLKRHNLPIPNFNGLLIEVSKITSTDNFSKTFKEFLSILEKSDFIKNIDAVLESLRKKDPDQEKLAKFKDDFRYNITSMATDIAEMGQKLRAMSPMEEKLASTMLDEENNLIQRVIEQEANLKTRAEASEKIAVEMLKRSLVATSNHYLDFSNKSESQALRILQSNLKNIRDNQIEPIDSASEMISLLLKTKEKFSNFVKDVDRKHGVHESIVGIQEKLKTKGSLFKPVNVEVEARNDYKKKEGGEYKINSMIDKLNQFQPTPSSTSAKNKK